MANTKQAQKRARQAEQRRKHNASQRSMVRTYIKRVIKAIQGGDHATAMTEFKAAQPVIDRIADKDALSKKKAARIKSRLNKRIKALAA
ncbi:MULTISPECIES: 30S ribosomal protein S20 [Halomonadaceae]|uniref:Small ribosomal subunit protein bS20 n=1 Tax=Modicisalibacter luteus TaxID=453962 RepID=A0ABV7LVD8_9GAMM|nr:30S ribosomal protein S20 [Halomonas lutea]MCG7601890.1 30S ribosomal protein S20 [Halomonas sp. McH1-25]MCP1343897.1 30S ribosomal protein S20 [Halomonas sp. FL8]MCP1362687.1 30S ribosomal protein S20 [Halomonas sp. BBD45]MCP1365049.1 30S ribosomal protein S20 [Halomonas sp. BBD48]GHB11682.1 30S ribosomal protein S20 [Halomonas lutea]